MRRSRRGGHEVGKRRHAAGQVPPAGHGGVSHITCCAADLGEKRTVVHVELEDARWALIVLGLDRTCAAAREALPLSRRGRQSEGAGKQVLRTAVTACLQFSILTCQRRKDTKM